MYLLFILFTLSFLLIVNRDWVGLFIKLFTKGNPKSKDIKDSKILNIVYSKTGLKLSKVKLLDTSEVWGMMGGMPFMPYMVISKEAYENFTDDELQWLLLHEAGHYVLWHHLKMLLLQLFFLIIGFAVLMNFSNSLLSLFLVFGLVILLVIVHTRLARRFEYEANYYAIGKMDNPEGLNNMFDKAKKRWFSKGLNDDGMKQRLFNVWILDIYKDLVLKANDYERV